MPLAECMKLRQWVVADQELLEINNFYYYLIILHWLCPLSLRKVIRTKNRKVEPEIYIACMPEEMRECFELQY